MTLPIPNERFTPPNRVNVIFNKFMRVTRFLHLNIQKIILIGLTLSLIACGSQQVPLGTASNSRSLTLIEEAPTLVANVENKQNPRLKQMLIAEFNLHRGNLNAAYESYLSLAQTQNDTTAIRRAADIAIAMNNLFLIEQSSQLWLTLESDNKRPYQLNYSIQINYQRDEAAKALLQNAINKEVNIDFIHEEINKNARKADQIDTIKTGLKQLNTLFSDNIEIDIALARIDFLEGDFNAALAKSEKLKAKIGKDKFGIESYLILAFSQNQNDQLKEAILSLEQALVFHKKNLRLLTPLLDFLVLDQQIDKSKHYYLNSNLSPEEGNQLSLNYISQLVESHYAPLALSLLKQLDYPTTGLADQFYYLEANALASLDRKEEGVDLLLKTTGPLKLSATEQAAAWLYELDDEARINDIVMSRLSEQQNLDMVLNICFLHEDEGRLDLADQLLTSALDIYINANSLRYKRALLADQRGFWLETEKELKYLVSLEPQNPQYLNALGYTLLQYTQKYDDAMQLIEKAYQINADDPAIIDSLGWGHFLLGNSEQAIFYLKKAWNLLKDPEIGAHFGEALWPKNPEQANQIWLQALDNEQNHDSLKDTIQRLNPTFDYPEATPKPPLYTDIAQEHTP
jgi:tetratricopeptide (TPR) repeat protein